MISGPNNICKAQKKSSSRKLICSKIKFLISYWSILKHSTRPIYTPRKTWPAPCFRCKFTNKTENLTLSLNFILSPNINKGRCIILGYCSTFSYLLLKRIRIIYSTIWSFWREKQTENSAKVSKTPYTTSMTFLSVLQIKSKNTCLLKTVNSQLLSLSTCFYNNFWLVRIFIISKSSSSQEFWWKFSWWSSLRTSNRAKDHSTRKCLKPLWSLLWNSIKL